ncbi:MAG TPA: DUF4349 domain-containing protein [Candidatus Limnocylindrales bacterium]|nr:DUF4349 domain-containing protein [Candidatus Limnocylindrales bacterium]
MLSTAHPTLWRALVVVLALLAALMVAACGGAASAPAGGPVYGGAPGATSGAGPAAPQSGGGDEQSAGNGNGNGSSTGNGDGGGGTGYPGVDQPGLLIVKNGNLTLQVAGIDDALAAATQKIDALGGYVSGSERGGDEDSAYATVTFRVPAANWDKALVDLRGLAQKVVDEKSSSDDVTGDVVDLAARIKNLQATEAALQAIMTRATAIKDVLTVQAELTTVRGQIEELSGQKAHFEQEAAYSTLTVAFTLKPTPVITVQQQYDPATEVDRASASLVGMLQALATAGIWFAIVWVPILLFLGVVGGFAYVIVRRLQRRAGGAAPSFPAAPPAAPTSA